MSRDRIETQGIPTQNILRMMHKKEIVVDDTKHPLCYLIIEIVKYSIHVNNNKQIF